MFSIYDTVYELLGQLKTDIHPQNHVIQMVTMSQ